MNNDFENNNITNEESTAEDTFHTEDIIFPEDLPADAEDSPSEEAVYESTSPAPEFTVVHKAPKKKKRTFLKVVALSLVAGMVFGSAFGVSNGFIRKLIASRIILKTTGVTLSKADSEETPSVTIDPTSPSESTVAAIAQECMPAVVAITNRSVSDVMTFFGSYEQESTSSGSGIIIGKNDTELLIVTNYHVVANSKELSVVFSPVESKLEKQSDNSGSYGIDDEDIPSAVVKGYDSSKDLAVIAVSLEDISSDILSQIKIATIGDSSSLRPGDQVVAIGNALGYGQSVTTGIISAVNRNITMESAGGGSIVTNTFIQTDAAINHGNSGGALLNMNGHVIGINSAKIASAGVEGMGYAIPISDVEDIIDELMVRQTRKIVDEDKQGFLGITGYDVSASASQMYGIPSGVYVESVIEDLAADKAGIKKGYIITKLDGYSITAIAQLQERLQYYAHGEKVKVTVKIPSGTTYKEKEIDLVLSNKAKNTK